MKLVILEDYVSDAWSSHTSYAYTFNTVLKSSFWFQQLKTSHIPFVYLYVCYTYLIVGCKHNILEKGICNKHKYMEHNCLW